MIQFDKVFEVFRNVIKRRIEPVIAEPIKVIQVRTTGAKPKEVFATMDIMFIDDKNSYLTNSWYDSANQEMVYETHKSVRLQLGVRNGNPDNLQGQMDVYTLCNHLHKAFAEEAILEYIYDNLEATVTSVLAVRTLSDFLPTGVGNIQAFDMLIGMNDVTRTAYTPIENVEIGGSVGGEDIDIDVTSPPPACIGLQLESTTGELTVERSLTNYTFYGIGEDTYIASNPAVPANTAFKYVWNYAPEVVSKLTLDTNVYTITHDAGYIIVKDSSESVLFNKPLSESGEIVFIINPTTPSALDYIINVNTQISSINSIEITMPEYTTGGVGLVFYRNDFDGIALPAGTRDICGNPIE